MSTKLLQPTLRAFLRPTSTRFQPTFPTRQFTFSAYKMGVHNIKSKAQFDSVIKGEAAALDAGVTLAAKSVVIVDSFAVWCGPCKAIAPSFEKWSNEPEFQNINFVKYDVDEIPELAQELGIRAMPTFIIFQNGNKADEVVGANPAAIKKALEKYAA